MKTARSSNSTALTATGLRLLFVMAIALLPMAILACDPPERLRHINTGFVF